MMLVGPHPSARKPLARYSATWRRARSRLAPPPPPDHSGVSSSCRRGVDSGCRLTLGRSGTVEGTGSIRWGEPDRDGDGRGRANGANGANDDLKFFRWRGRQPPLTFSGI